MAEIEIRPDRLYPVIMQTENCVNGDAAKQTEVKPEVKMEDKNTEEKSISLIDGKQNYKRKPQKHTSNSCSASRLWVFFTVLFFLTTVAAVAAFIWRHSFYDESSNECMNKTENNTKIILQRYSGFFRSRREQTMFANKFYQYEYKNRVYANMTSKPYNSSGCAFVCRPKSEVPNKKKRQVQLASTHFHACCISETSFISPDELPGIDDVPRTLAHFDDDDQRQYFQTQTCQQVLGCNGCQCTQVIDTHTALIETDDDTFLVEMVKVPGCCKCLNG